VIHYREVLDGAAQVIEQTKDGEAVAVQTDGQTYLGGWLDETALARVLRRACDAANVETVDLPDGARIRDTGEERFYFNYTAEHIEIEGINLPPAGIHRVKRQSKPAGPTQ
jgi:beta-galactosidase